MWLSIIVGDKNQEEGATANVIMPFDPTTDSVQNILDRYGGEDFVYGITIVYDREMLED